MSAKKVSVVMISYNHAAYIEEAILSILNQKCDFAFELIISDDASKDDTVHKINSIIQTHPKGNLINFHAHTENIGMMKNFGFALLEAKADYIAICEGDDYWTDEHKLNKQFNVLEKNPDCVLSFHNAKTFNQNTKISSDFNTYSQQKYKAEDLFDTWLIPTASSFFRNVLPAKLPEFLQKGTHGDIALFLLLGNHGGFHCTNEFMSVYRINDTGVTQSGFKGIQHNLAHIEQLENMQPFFAEKHEQNLAKRISDYHLSNAFHYANEKDKQSGLKSLKRALKVYPQNQWRKLSFVIRTWLKIKLS